MRPRDLSQDAALTAMHVYTKRFSSSGGPDDEGRWSEEPAQHLYSMSPAGDGPRGGERLPAPAAIREPASTQGPDARGEARGGAIEVEYEETEAEAGVQDDWDDYWS
jgi:hypothetical protein